MARLSTKKSKLDARRRTVASLRLRHLTEREISEKLEETETPASPATVHRDIKYLEAQWKAESRRDIAELKANHLAELKEARRVAWEGQNGKPQLFYVLKSLEQEARVAGLEEKDAGEEIAEKARVYLDLLAKVHQDAEDLSEK
jgi:DeoR/GlpR family transcriptional regulator of sugar metabolism